LRSIERDACGIGFVADASGRPSRSIVTAALTGLANVKHRGAVNADEKSADGSGLLLPLPPKIFGDGHGVAFLFVRGDDPRADVERAIKEEGLELVEWRSPAFDSDAIGELAQYSQPKFLQAIFRCPDGKQSERSAYRLRRRIEQYTDDLYVASCSFRTIVYKGLIAADALGTFWDDLRDDRFETPFAIFHQRFSTNTLPTWERAQPFRMLCHNGEINALAGNQARMRSRAILGTEEAGLGDEELFHPVLSQADSDSGQLDSVIELLTRGGRDVRHAIAMTVPEAWEGARDLDPAVRGFYRYHASLMEPWDGPAGLVFTDGLGVGAALDRNGLRPLRWAVCSDGFVTASSEAGAVDVSGHGTVTRGRLGPGEMLFVDPKRGVMLDQDNKERLAAGGPYARWAGDGLRPMSRGRAIEEPMTGEELQRRQVAHGYTVEDLRMILKPMVEQAKEPVFAMGDDTPLPNMAGRARPLPHFFRQRFAQVTNPPIDHLRERLVMSLRTLIGPRQPILTERPEAARLISTQTFFLYPSAVDELCGEQSPFGCARFDATLAVADGADALRGAVEALADAAAEAVRAGAGVIVLDNSLVSEDRAPIPSLLAVGAVHQRLIADGLRSLTSIVVIADDARDTHAMACLLGFGADAISPQLALETVAADAEADEDSEMTGAEAQERFQAAIEDGVLKIMSKMGISTLDSYRYAQIFESLSLSREVIDVCFTGTTAEVGGIGWLELGEDVLENHAGSGLTNPGYFRDLKRGGEYHTHNKDVVKALQDMSVAHLLQKAIAAAAPGSEQDADDAYRTFADMVNSRAAAELHDLLELVPAGEPIPIEEVESAGDIVKRFSTGAMSHGSLSAEAHETLAEAMNLVGGKSNCGEGGEARYRYATRGQATGDKNSKIKQIASGRFGVTPEYLAHADELQIKVAQGSKPGEGGQLPGHKVTDEIAELRHTQPGVTLISPPPHHDIYSIEDLAQLIFDLKQINGFADVSVKLVAGDGVGTIAAGVVKALADIVHISGANGGTGASPLSSIKHAGMPWELGLADTQRMLIENGLRDRVKVRVDGGFMTGRDVMIAALLGADEYSFGTAAMIAEGCIMLRACHKDTCSVGVATQKKHLRAKFTGTPEGVATYMLFIATEVRELLASLGFRTLDEAIGRVECLRQKVTGDARVDAADVTVLIEPPSDPKTTRHFVKGSPIQRPRCGLGDKLLADAYRLVWDGDDIELDYAITNADRTIGAALSGALALEFGNLPPLGSVTARFTGEAGQSFGAFLNQGVNLDLTGEANDYVGKGMGGGRIVIRPPANDASLMSDDPSPASPVLAGNTCLYGATGGEVFIAGAVGERFGVRNSGAVAVVEGAGDHACEYMTGGRVVILGPVGYNVGAGMSGGEAYVWDPRATLTTRINPAMVEAERPDAEHLEEVRWLIDQHAELTGSRLARALLDHWEQTTQQLWLVAPIDRVKRIELNHAGRVGVNA
jgi:glutamate synthase domain-containing protein 2/glutamate synthase domain-containing protein 1/glutamate synthase domain-containing protein 3